jgi:hypothetical protein
MFLSSIDAVKWRPLASGDQVIEFQPMSAWCILAARAEAAGPMSAWCILADRAEAAGILPLAQAIIRTYNVFSGCVRTTLNWEGIGCCSVECLP